jgi:hypothetical protein
MAEAASLHAPQGATTRLAMWKGTLVPLADCRPLTCLQAG